MRGVGCGPGVFLTSTQLFKQPGSLTSPETVWVRVSCGPTLLPSPDVTWLPNFSGTPNQWPYSLLCVSHWVFFPQYLQASRYLLVQDWLPFSRRGGAEKIQLLTRLSSKAPAAATVPGTGPGTAAAVVLAQVPGTFPSTYTISLLSFNVLCSLWFPNFI